MKKTAHSTSLGSTRIHTVFYHPITPFFLVVGAIMSDYLTTTLGLTLGFYEANPHYHPLWGLIAFCSIITAFTVLFPRQKQYKLGILGVASVPYLALINNVLVILGLFPGIQAG